MYLLYILLRNASTANVENEFKELSNVPARDFDAELLMTRNSNKSSSKNNNSSSNNMNSSNRNKSK